MSSTNSQSSEKCFLKTSKGLTPDIKMKCPKERNSSNFETNTPLFELLMSKNF